MIAVIGDLMLDIYLLSTLREAEQPGGVAIRPGGSAANTAAWLGYLGRRVSFIGCNGLDSVGDMLVRELAGYGVETHVRLVTGWESGAVVVELTEERERVMRSSRGANMALAPCDLRSPRFETLTYVHLTGYALLDPHGLEILRAAGELARAHAAPLVFDPASVGVIRAFGRSTLLEEIRDTVDVIVPNATEAAELTGTTDIAAAARTLLPFTQLVVITDGPTGAYYATQKSSGRVQTVAEQPVDTTGAGDAFNAGLLSGLDQGWPPRRAVAEGNRIAGQVIVHLGGRPAQRSN